MSQLTAEERQLLVSRFEELDVKPRLDDAEALQHWMEDYVKSKNKPAPRSEVRDTAPIRMANLPRVATFSGSGDKDISYEAWRYEVCTLLKESSYAPQEVSIAVKKSLRGEAANVVCRLGFEVDLETMLEKMDGIYGLVEDAENLMSQFYGATQGKGENVSSWGCRLEDMLFRAQQQNPLSNGSQNDMLRTKFWSGLQPRLKEAARHKLDHVKDFDKLRVEVRKIECELEKTSTSETRKAQVHMTMAEETQQSEMEALKGMVCQLGTQLKEIQKSMNSTSQEETRDTRPRGNYRGRFRGSHRPYQRGRSRYYSQRTYFTPDHPDQNGQRQEVERNRDTVCYRCGQEGHVAYGCRVDLAKKHLNTKESV